MKREVFDDADKSHDTMSVASQVQSGQCYHLEKYASRRSLAEKLKADQTADACAETKPLGGIISPSRDDHSSIQCKCDAEDLYASNDIVRNLPAQSLRMTAATIT